METEHYTVCGLHVARVDNIYTMPALWDVDRGQLERREACFSLEADGGEVYLATHNGRYLVERIDSPLRGWGALDCGYHYTAGRFVLSGPALDKIAEYSGVALPAAV